MQEEKAIRFYQIENVIVKLSLSSARMTYKKHQCLT